MQKKSEAILVYVGTWTHTDEKSEGIYLYRLDLSSGALEFTGLTPAENDPAYLALDPQQRFIYVVHEDLKPHGAVSAFSIHPETGALTHLNQRSTQSAGPCYLSTDKTGKCVLVSNYSSGSVCLLPIEEDGRVGAATDHVQHKGSSVNPDRQTAPHPHSIVVDPSNRFAFVPDLGLDKVLIYQLDVSGGRLKPNDTPWIQVKAGAGPRHLVFHPGGGYAFLANELDSTITSFTYDQSSGTLREVLTVSALPEEFDAENTCSDIHVAPSGAFVYGSNRGHDSIVIFAVSQNTGELTLVGHESTRGETPRGFAIDPTENFLLAANQDTDTVVSFRIDPQTGGLSSTGHVVEVPSPVCVKMIQRVA